MDNFASFIINHLVADADGNVDELTNFLKIVQMLRHDPTTSTTSLLDSLERITQERIEDEQQATTSQSVMTGGQSTSSTPPSEPNPYQLFPRSSRRPKRTSSQVGFSAQ